VKFIRGEKVAARTFMSKNLLVSVFLLLLLSSCLFFTTFQPQSQNPPVSRTPSSKWTRVGKSTDFYFDLTFSPNGDLYGTFIEWLMRSTDKGRSCKTIKVDPPPPYTTLTSVAAARDGLILVAAKSQSGDGSIILRSSDGGASWTHTKFTPDGKNDGFNFDIQSLMVDRNGGLWAGTDLAHIFRSTDGGRTWTEPGKIESFEPVAGLATGPGGEIYAAVARTGIFRSTDEGRTWTETGFGKHPVDSVAVNGKGHVFAGTMKRGVFRSTDGGRTWTSINDGLPGSDGPVLALDEEGYLYAGTLRSGLFRSAISTMDDRFVSD
jgi:photosystem II stability/assembly factor-like uncharacterized protein